MIYIIGAKNTINPFFYHTFVYIELWTHLRGKFLLTPLQLTMRVKVPKLVGGILKPPSTLSRHVWIKLPRVNAMILVLPRKDGKVLFPNLMNKVD